MKKFFVFGVILFFTVFSAAQDEEVDNPIFEDEEVIDQIEELNKFSDDQIGLKPFIYSGRGRKSPFQKPAGIDIELTEKADLSEEVIQLSGLEGYDLDSFKLTTILWDIKHPKALVKAANNETYVLEQGTKIGRSNGYVAKIREGEVIVIESTYPNGEDGRKLYKTQVLKLGR